MSGTTAVLHHHSTNKMT